MIGNRWLSIRARLLLGGAMQPAGLWARLRRWTRFRKILLVTIPNCHSRIFVKLEGRACYLLGHPYRYEGCHSCCDHTR